MKVETFFKLLLADNKKFVSTYHAERGDTEYGEEPWRLNKDASGASRVARWKSVVKALQKKVVQVNEVQWVCCCTTPNSGKRLVFGCATSAPKAPFGESFRVETLVDFKQNNADVDLNIYNTVHFTASTIVKKKITEAATKEVEKSQPTFIKMVQREVQEYHVRRALKLKEIEQRRKRLSASHQHPVKKSPRRSLQKKEEIPKITKDMLSPGTPTSPATSGGGGFARRTARRLSAALSRGSVNSKQGTVISATSTSTSSSSGTSDSGTRSTVTGGPRDTAQSIPPMDANERQPRFSEIMDPNYRFSKEAPARSTTTTLNSMSSEDPSSSSGGGLAPPPTIVIDSYTNMPTQKHNDKTKLLPPREMPVEASQKPEPEIWKTLSNRDNIILERVVQTHLQVLRPCLKERVEAKYNIPSENIVTILRCMTAHMASEGIQELALELMDMICSTKDNVKQAVVIPQALHTIGSAINVHKPKFQKYHTLFDKMQATYSSMMTKRDHEFRKLFNISELLVNNFACGLSQGFTRYGRMYITPSWVCFQGSFTHIVIAIGDILNIKSSRTAYVFNTGITITTGRKAMDGHPAQQDRQYHFTSFMNRDRALTTLKSAVSDLATLNGDDSTEGPSFGSSF
eukprot:TRINITY_DN68172_c6_g2_i1.p1 TRINITY_DN68172_c6_g2~~TRINITY_DN68172_c6_g2_i1.p1  ORF type:complete len:709 (+),score=68.99 TRINITY_DN68172_c6_g2_i1:243-2129(+)